MNNKISPFLKLALVAGLLFLYIPLFIYSYSKYIFRYHLPYCVFKNSKCC